MKEAITSLNRESVILDLLVRMESTSKVISYLEGCVQKPCNSEHIQSENVSTQILVETIFPE